MVLEQYLGTHILIHEHEAEKRITGNVMLLKPESLLSLTQLLYLGHTSSSFLSSSTN